MPSSNPRCAGRSVFAEALESRTLLSSTPILLHQIISTGKVASYHESSLNGVPFTVQIRNGQVQIFKVDNRLELNVTGTDATSTLKVISQPRLQFADVVVAGSLKTFAANGMTLVGTMAVSGSIEKLSMGGIGGTLAVHDDIFTAKVGGVRGTIAVGGTIDKLTTGALNNATILSGAVLPADSPNGITNDQYSPGTIDKLIIHGPVINSNVAVGVSPGPDDIFGNADDSNAGGGGIADLTVGQGADATSHFEAGSFGTVKTKPYSTTQPVKKLAIPTSDPHFIIPKSAAQG